MKDIPTNIDPEDRSLIIDAQPDHLKKTESILKALSSAKRIGILNYLSGHAYSVLEIAEALEMPFTTTTQHINILERAGLIKTELQPSKRGLKKVCQRVYDRINLQLWMDEGMKK